MSDYSRWLQTRAEAQGERETLEFSHSNLPNPIRLCNYEQEAQQYTLESTAPINPGQTVTFQPSSFIIDDSGDRQDGDMTLAINFGTIGNQIFDQYQALGAEAVFNEPVQVIYRKFYTGNTSEPVLVKKLKVAGITLDGFTSSAINCEDVDLANKASGRYIDINLFPELAGFKQ